MSGALRRGLHIVEGRSALRPLFVGLRAARRAARRPESVPSRPSLRVLEVGVAPTFPVDVVFTWVDLEDGDRQEALRRYRPDLAPDAEEASLGAADLHGSCRYRSNDELRYALRSIDRYAPWVNHIYVVTDGSRPGWLVEGDRLTVVPHHAILEEQHLPTFNSHVIESALHRIPGLSERFLYLNDDMMFLAPVERTDFFTENGLALVPVGNARLDEGPPQPEENANRWASKNAARLLDDAYGFRPDLRLKHQALPQLRSIAELSEQRMPEVYAAVRANRFRTMEDVLCTGFLHPWTAFLEGRAVVVRTKGWFVRIRLELALERYARILAERDDPRRIKFGCFNDGADEGEPLDDHERHLHATLETLYPDASPFESTPAVGQTSGV